ncbi:MAG: PDZ domain-containing protein, partial [Planctomycetota bacterium]|nr:PDZ domain-containing protein [Planctomycetota bacterium]
IPDKVLWPYPHPKSVGLIMDPEEMATVQEVAPDSLAAAAGLQAGDSIQSFSGQPILSIADVQWVLHNADPAGEKIAVSVMRKDRPLSLKLSLEDGWRRKSDLSWRVTSWGLRRMASGGLLLETLPDDARRELSLPRNTMALRVKHAGKYGLHGTAHRAGVKEGDVITEFDSRKDLMTEQDLLTYVVTSKKPDDRVTIKVLRGRQPQSFVIPIQP